ncbi:16S rRNA (guanine(527)-N(7))-methyltransferase RsmG [Gammaproteobacteria bacterium]|nr:16S rRNA (guanine(527)-N(7))-methyltransferase RsmG [Gammaproteobacteria bacterium]
MDLKELIAASSLNLTDIQVSQADKYLNEILKWNKTRNLVSRNLRKNDLAEHFLDCAVLQKHLMPGSVIDLGTGSGFPGICLGIIDPNRELTLVDSNRKKTSFLIHIKNELGLNSVSIKNLRVEEIEQINETNIVCRAFKEPATLLKSLENKITKKNKIILMVSEKEPLSAQGFDIAFKESEASKILGKKRGFLEIQMS